MPDHFIAAERAIVLDRIAVLVEIGDQAHVRMQRHDFAANLVAAGDLVFARCGFLGDAEYRRGLEKRNVG